MDDYIREEEELKKQKMLEMEGLGEWEGELEDRSSSDEFLVDPSSEEPINMIEEKKDPVLEPIADGIQDESNVEEQKKEAFKVLFPSSTDSENINDKKPSASEVQPQPESQSQPSETSSSGATSDSNAQHSSEDKSSSATPPANVFPDELPELSIENTAEAETGSSIRSQNDKASSRHVAPSTPPPSVKSSTPTPTTTSVSASTPPLTQDDQVPLEMRPPTQEVFEVGAASSTFEKGSASNVNQTNSTSITSVRNSTSTLVSAISSHSNQSSSSTSSTISSSTAIVPSGAGASSAIPEQPRSSPNTPPVAHHGSGNSGGGGGGSESIYRTISKRLSALESNATLSLQYIEHSGQALREVFARMEKRQEEKMGEMLRALNGSNWRQIEALVSLIMALAYFRRLITVADLLLQYIILRSSPIQKRRQHVDLQRALFEFDVHRQQVDAERVSLLAQVHVLADEVSDYLCSLRNALSLKFLLTLDSLLSFLRRSCSKEGSVSPN